MNCFTVPRWHAYRWSRMNRLDARMRWATAVCGTASIRTRDPWVIRSIAEPDPAWRLWPNSSPVIWQSRRSPSATRTRCYRECDPEAWATPSPSPESDDWPTDRDGPDLVHLSAENSAASDLRRIPPISVVGDRDWLRGGRRGWRTRRDARDMVPSSLYPWTMNAGMTEDGSEWRRPEVGRETLYSYLDDARIIRRGPFLRRKNAQSCTWK